jgi:hypothetical protein
MCTPASRDKSFWQRPSRTPSAARTEGRTLTAVLAREGRDRVPRVGVARFELATSRPPAERATRLRHTPRRWPPYQAWERVLSRSTPAAGPMRRRPIAASASGIRRVGHISAVCRQVPTYCVTGATRTPQEPAVLCRSTWLERALHKGLAERCPRAPDPGTRPRRILEDDDLVPTRTALDRRRDHLGDPQQRQRRARSLRAA